MQTEKRNDELQKFFRFLRDEPLLHLLLGETGRRIARLVQIKTVRFLTNRAFQVSRTVFRRAERRFESSTVDLLVGNRLDGAQRLVRAGIGDVDATGVRLPVVSRRRDQFDDFAEFAEMFETTQNFRIGQTRGQTVDEHQIPLNHSERNETK